LIIHDSITPTCYTGSEPLMTVRVITLMSYVTLPLVTGFVFLIKKKAKHQSSCNIRPLVAAKGGSQFTRFSAIFNHTRQSTGNFHHDLTSNLIVKSPVIVGCR